MEQVKTKKIEFLCPRCKKHIEVKSERDVKTHILQFLTCGHIIKAEKLKVNEPEKSDEITSLDGKKLLEYQKTGVQFCEQSNMKCLIADEMGLGKTVQALATIKNHPEKLPALIVCKSALTMQWQYEVIRWLQIPPMIIKTSNDKNIFGFQVYIVSFDLLRRLDKAIFPRLRTIIIDECQQIKNHGSARTNHLRQLLREQTSDNCGVIALSGTPIKNRPSEYFPILNVIKPDKFPNRKSFVRNWIEMYRDWSNKGAFKEGGLKNIESWNRYTKDFIIRRTREEVLPDLPKVSRRFQYIEFTEEFKQAYDKTVKEFAEYFENQPNPFDFKNYSVTLGFMARMRQITGLAKIESVYDFLDEFLLETERKTVVFLHHLNAAKLLTTKLKLNNRNYLELNADLTPDQRASIIEEFKNNPDYRVLIASTLSSGEGLNLQFCSDMIMMERQWNPANEEQCESRFCRIGQINPINATYFVAVGTIDEFLTQLVEKKRAIFSQAMEGKEVDWQESGVMKELTEIIFRQSRG